MMGMLLPVASCIAMILTAIACSSDDDAPADAMAPGTTGGSGGASSNTGDFLGACDTRASAGGSEGQCRDWRGEGGPDLAVSCDGLEGDFRATTPCPAEARVATCSLDPILGAAAIYNYYAPTYSASDAESACRSLDGTFHAESSAGGTGGTSGAGGAASSGGTPSTDCPPECLRAYECVEICGDTPRNYGCCPCPTGWIDVIQCR